MLDQHLDQHSTWHTQGMPEAGGTGAEIQVGLVQVLWLFYRFLASAPASLVPTTPKGVQGVVNLGGSTFICPWTRDKYHFSVNFFQLSLLAGEPSVKWAEIRSGRVHLSSSVERNQTSKSHELRTEISHEIASNAASNAGVKTPIV